MNLSREFEVFHYHASCAVTHLARMALALTAKCLEWILKVVIYVQGRLTEPRNPEINYEIHVQ